MKATLWLGMMILLIVGGVMFRPEAAREIPPAGGI